MAAAAAPEDCERIIAQAHDQARDIVKQDRAAAFSQPSREYQEVLELLSSEPLRDGRVSPLRWWSHTLMQGLDPTGIDFTADDLKAEGKADFDVEWSAPIGGDAERPSTVADLAYCPLSGLPHERDQVTEMKMSTIVQYLRVLSRTQPASKKVQLLVDEARKLDLAGDNLLPGAEAFIAASRRPAGGAERATSPAGRDVERVLSMIVDGVQGMPAHKTCKALVDVAKRAVFGTGAPVLQRIIEDSRFLNCKVSLYERVALNCARVVLKDKAEQVCMHQLKVRQRAGSASPVRAKSRTCKVRRLAATAKSDLAHNASLPSKFVDRASCNADSGQPDDLIVLSKKGPATISVYQRGRTLLTPSDARSSLSSVWTPPAISPAAVGNGTMDESKPSVHSMNWKLDELLRMRKTVEELTEERDKAVKLYQDALTTRKRAQKECRDAQLESAQIEAVIPAMLEGLQDVSAAVACADAEARAQWRQIAFIDGISRSMLEGLERVFAEFQRLGSDRATLREDLSVIGRKLRKYRGKLDTARNENTQLSARLADMTGSLAQSEQERRRTAEEHAMQVQKIAQDSRLEIATLAREHKTQIVTMTGSMAALEEVHAKFVTEAQQQHEESMARLQEQREKDVAEVEAQRKQEVADLDGLRKQQLAELEARLAQELAHSEARRAQKVAELSAKLENEVKEHSLSVAKLKADHGHFVSDLQTAHAREIAELKGKWEAEVDELKTAWSTDVNMIKQQHAKEVGITRVEHQRRLELIEKEACLGTRCCAEKENFKHRLKQADDECNRLMRNLETAEAALQQKSLAPAKSSPAENPQLQDVRDALTKTQEALTREKDESQKLRADLMLIAANNSQLQRELGAAKAGGRAHPPGTKRMQEGFHLDSPAENPQLQDVRDALTKTQEALTREKDESQKLRADMTLIAANNTQLQRELEAAKASTHPPGTHRLQEGFHGEEAAQTAKDLQELRLARSSAESELSHVKEESLRAAKELQESQQATRRAESELEEVREKLARTTKELDEAKVCESTVPADSVRKYQELLHQARDELQKAQDAAREESVKNQQMLQMAQADALKYQQQLQVASEELSALKQATAENSTRADSRTAAAAAAAEAKAKTELQVVRAALSEAQQDAAKHKSDLVKARDEIWLLKDEAWREADHPGLAGGLASGSSVASVQPACGEAIEAERDRSSTTETAEASAALAQAQSRVQHLDAALDAAKQALAEAKASHEMQNTQAESRVQHLETALEASRQALAEARDLREIKMRTCTGATKEASSSSFEVEDLSARLQVATKDLQHVRAQLKACQQSRDEAIKARELSEERADEHTHELKIVREELRVAIHKMEDWAAERERMQQLLVDSKATYTYTQVQEAEAAAALAQETLRKRNSECSELKSLVRSLESELKLLSEDRARQTTREAAERREVQGRYRASEDGRRALELEKIQMKAEIDGKDTRIRQLKQEVLSKKWHIHSGVEEQRREEDGQLIMHLQQELERSSRARENAEARLALLMNIGLQAKKKPSHVFKEPLYRAQLLEQNSKRSWGRVAPETDLHSCPLSSLKSVQQLPDAGRENGMDRGGRPTSAPTGGRQRALQAKNQSLRLQIHSDAPAMHISPCFSPSVPYSKSPPKSDSKVSYRGSSFMYGRAQPGTAARYYGDPGVLYDDEAYGGAGVEKELTKLRGELREVQAGRREELQELREAIRGLHGEGGGRGLRERGPSTPSPNKVKATSFSLTSVAESEELPLLSQTQGVSSSAQQKSAKKDEAVSAKDRAPAARRPGGREAVKQDRVATTGPSGKLPALEEAQLSGDSEDSADSDWCP